MYRTTKGTAKTKYQEPESRAFNRLFGVKEAPTFHPTRDEFKDPLAYIAKIKDIGQKYGIIKIAPPTDYNPGFSLKTESFCFKTCIQKLNSMERETRASTEYAEKVQAYYKLTRKSTTKIPELDKRPINLYKLKTEVAARGGFQTVTKLRKWAEIGKELGYARKKWTSLSNILRIAYQKVVLPYETWYGKQKRDIDQVTTKEGNGSSSSSDSAQNDNCEACHKHDNEDTLLLCDGCNRGFHAYCLNPPLSSVPKTDWFCSQCITTVKRDYDFQLGNEYSLNDFYTVCDNFKANWFKKTHPQGTSTVTENDCEREFWRLMSSSNETRPVECGANLHESGHSIADHMLKSLFNLWDLNVIPVAPRALLTGIKSDISGLMAPWLYAGMCFSASSWHREEQFNHSISYMHWGETKTWYGVPVSDTAKFQDAIRKAAPALSKQQLDLLFQREAMLSPERLTKENVNVYAVDQRPGQFVVTYPQAYHSGFSHGFNLCENVNFAHGSWVDYGLEFVESCKSYRQQPCFPLDYLLVTAVRNRSSWESIEWLARGLEKMQSREMKERQQVRARDLEERVVVEADFHEELQCVFCSCYSYLSYIGCSCTSAVACLEHVEELCTCDVSSKVMHLQFTDDQLLELVSSAILADFSCRSWFQTLEDMLNCKTGLDIKNLKRHVESGRRYLEMPQWLVDSIEEYISALHQWNADAKLVLDTRQDNSKQTPTQTRYEQCQDLVERAQKIIQSQNLIEIGGRVPKIGLGICLLPHVNLCAAELEDVDNQITDELFASNDISHQKAVLDQGTRIRSDSDKFQKLAKFMGGIKATCSISSTYSMEPVSTLESVSTLGSTAHSARAYAQPKRPSARKKTNLNQNQTSSTPITPAKSSASSGPTMDNTRTYVHPRRPSSLKKTINYKPSSSCASSSSSVSFVGSSQSYQQYSSHEEPTENYRGKGKGRENTISTNDIKPVSQIITATQFANSTLQSVNIANSVNRPLKRKSIATVGPLPTPQRPAKVIKLTLRPPKPTNADFPPPPSLSPSSSATSPTFSISSPTFPHPVPLCNTLPTSPGKKRKHRQDDASNENTESGKKSKYIVQDFV